ncbi:MAG: 7-cyano-7-deazaguanine synthase [Desulfovibrio sp.]|uniref:PD-(D/E)XK nuclease domain-containing protein n=1 Tax=Desulfovibrio sp. TaxID=885 RepID=UPI002A35F701|nr:hypothetical protein [Desulfovibrio sp.]MDY0258590.1 7-cyano-7-deazaguanine synthase [Desulfovibrio sp.]
MSRAVSFLCNGAQETPLCAGRVTKEIVSDPGAANRNVNIVIENLDSRLRQHISSRQYDLIEIASFIYTADALVLRTDKKWTGEDTDDGWERDFHFVIPVYDFEFWNTEAVKTALQKLLTFLVNGKFLFEFFPKTASSRQYQYFLGESITALPKVEKVILFSGGLDSLAGAIENISAGIPVALVSHRSVSTMNARQKKLIDELGKIYSGTFMHVPVWINKKSARYHEYTQRSRSFLYSSLAVVVAEILGVREVNFYENGIVSLNLPLTDEVLRSRATRTTHPLALKLFQEFFNLCCQEPISFQNPYIFFTKKEVVGITLESKAKDLIHLSSSCTRTIMASSVQKHCGVCSQCIDRRIAVLSHKSIDTSFDYVTDVFLGERKVDQVKNTYDKGVAVSYMRFANEINKMSEEEFDLIYGSFINDAADALDGYNSIRPLIDMHKRHAATVVDVLEQQIIQNKSVIASGDLQPNSLMSFVLSGAHTQESSKLFTENIGNILSKAIPLACRSEKPKNETHLQDICSAILASAEEDIQREFPYVAWSFSLSKPDFSDERTGTFIELKYVKKGQTPSKITEQIAADLTKYDVNNRAVLFVIYDPERVIPDDDVFQSGISHHPTAYMRIIR